MARETIIYGDQDSAILTHLISIKKTSSDSSSTVHLNDEKIPIIGLDYFEGPETGPHLSIQLDANAIDISDVEGQLICIIGDKRFNLVDLTNYALIPITGEHVSVERLKLFDSTELSSVFGQILKRIDEMEPGDVARFVFEKMAG